MGKACGEGKTWFRKYIKSVYGARRVVAAIKIKSNKSSICHALSKHPLATTNFFLFDIWKLKKIQNKIDYEVLDDLKDGDAFASKYSSQELKIKEPNMVLVFSNDTPDTKELASDRWKLFFIVNDQL